jgi:DNA-binding GntR family transcriptional regulator
MTLVTRYGTRTKTSAAVVDYVLQEIFEGGLKAGDRIDLDQVCADLDVSRLPVREAVVILERDGILSTRYHRGVFVEPFDEQSIIDDFEVVGLLSGLAVRRLAEKQDAATIDALQQLVRELQAVDANDRNEMLRLVREILVLEHRVGGSRRLRAELRSFVGFFPWVFRISMDQGHRHAVTAHSRVVQAIAAGDGETAAEVRLKDFRAVGTIVVRDLKQRGVLDRHD